MNKIISILSFLIFSVFYVTTCSAQVDTAKAMRVTTDTIKKNLSYKVGIFAPLYLDSVFNDNGFKYSQSIPRFIMPALDFVQGAEIALDSMPAGNSNIEATIFDSKGYMQTIPWLIQNGKMDSLNLIVGNIKDAEFKQLADFAQLHNIPFISATYPNDGGITANPYLLIANPTLRSHCEAIFSYIVQAHGTDRILLCRQKGAQEEMVAGYFKQLNEQDGKQLLDIRTINCNGANFIDELRAKLDSNHQNLVIGGSLEESFAGKLAASLAGLNKKYPVTLIGMPTWDGFTSLHKKDALKDFPVYFTTPYYNSKTDDNSKMLINTYNKKFKAKPSDMVFKGYEMIRLFVNILTKYPGDFMNHFNDKSVTVFNDYLFRPVMLKKENTVPDYFENKHLYFIKLLNGNISRAW